MNENNQDPKQNWESSYRTGSTQPPKPKSGCFIALLAIIIFLGGIASALSLLNIHLFTSNKAPEATVGFFEETEATETQGSQEAVIPEDGDISIELNNTPTAVENIPQEGGLSLQDIYDSVIDAVVSISSNTGTGTGVIIDTAGYIVTNYHVIEGSRDLHVLLSDGRTVSAQTVGKDSISDLAVLRIEASGLTAAEFGDSDAVRVGDSVVAIGDPLGIELRGTMTDGIISAINRDITTDGRTMTLLQTNAALNSGNSGGPLLNCFGQVIGINVMKLGDSMSASSVEGLGFAIPSATVKEVVDQLVTQGYVSGRPTMGITGQTLSAFDTLYYRLPQGIYITAVAQGSDAAAQGISAGDILIAIEGEATATAEDFRSILYRHAAGDQVTVDLYRSGQYYAVTVTLDEGKE